MTRWTDSAQYDPWENYPSLRTRESAERFNEREQALATYAEGLAAEVGFDAQQFGAKGDGATDDADALNAYFTAKAGQTVLLPPGTYLAGKTLLPAPGTRIVGNGAKILASPSLPGGSFLLTNVASPTDITIQGVEIDGNRAARSAGSGSLMEFRGTNGTLAKRIKVIDCYLHDSPGPTVAFQNVERIQVVRNHISGGGRDGVLLQAGNRDAVIEGNVIYDQDDDLIGVHSGPESTNQSYNIVVANNVLDGSGQASGHGIAVNGLDRFAVVGNVIWQAYGGGILATNHDAFELRNGVIANNVVKDTGFVSNAEGYGIHLGVPTLSSDYYSTTAIANVKNIALNGNTITGSLKSGIRLRSGSAISALRAIGNDSTLNGTYGFEINGQSGLIVALNDFRNNTTAAINGSKTAGDIWHANRGDIPAITGSRGGNAALASLLTALATAGVITDGTSA